jgi:mono/diheme cytochrome c family protein
VRKIVIGLLALAFAGVGVGLWTSHAAEGEGEECCKAGDTTPPVELVKKIPPGKLHSPYQDYAKLAKDEDLVKQFRLPGCNECHGGTGGGGFCPALTQGVWFWGNTDDVLFRLATLGSAELEKQGFHRIQYGSVHAPMPPMGFAVPTADQLWKIIAFIRSINPPGTNPPEKIIPGRFGTEEQQTGEEHKAEEHKDEEHKQ